MNYILLGLSTVVFPCWSVSRQEERRHCLGGNVFEGARFAFEYDCHCGSECMVISARTRALKLETEIKPNDVSSQGGGA